MKKEDNQDFLIFKASLSAALRGIDDNKLKNVMNNSKKFIELQEKLILETDFTNEQLTILNNLLEQVNQIILELMNREKEK